MLTLVTGASGHIGNTLVKKLLDRGRSVRALVRESSKLDGLKGKDGQLLPGLEVAYGDVLAPLSLHSALRGVTHVFHTAAIFKTRNVDESLMIETNLEGTRNVLQAAAVAKVERIVYTSSVAAVGCRRRPDQLMTERDWNSDPIDVYVSTKTESEHLAHDLQRRLDLPLVIVNPATVLGPNDFGPTPSNDFILLAMKKAPPVYFDSGHSYVDVEDVAEGHLLAEAKGRIGERYILGGENVSNRDLFDRIAALTGGRKPFAKVGHGFVDVVGTSIELKVKLLGGTPLFTRSKAHKLIDYYGYFDSTRARTELGYAPRPLAEILPRTHGWFVDQGWL